jgi:hypothetical protein
MQPESLPLDTAKKSNGNQLLDAALDYEAAGLSVLRANRISKVPITSWTKYQEKRADPEELKSIFAEVDGCAALSIVTGKVSNNLEIEDFDNKGELFEPWKELVIKEAPGLIDRLVIAKTQNNGWHVIYRCLEATIPGSEKLAERGIEAPNGDELAINNKNYKPRKVGDKYYAVISLIETRGEGAQFLTEPTPGYEIIQGDLRNTPIITTQERQILINAAKALNEWVDPGKVEGAGWKLSKDTRRPGDDYNKQTDPTPLLVAHGWEPVGERGAYQHFRRPGKDRGQSASLINGKWFHVFTSNGAPFDPDKTYSPFATYTLLKHEGDYSKAASELAREGYGEPEVPIQFSFELQTIIKVKPLEVAAYHGLVGDFVRMVEPHTEADPVALLVQTLVCFGNVIGRGAYCSVEADRHHLNAFVCLVGETSRARKGTSLGHIKGRVMDVDPEWRARIMSGLSSGEGLIWAVRDPIVRHELIKETGRTEEVITDAGIADKRLQVVEAEFANVLRVMGREGNNLSAIIRNSWDGDDLRTLTKNSPAVATGAHISIIGHITRDELKRYLDRTEAANGFGNRFMWFCVSRSKYLPEGGNLKSENFKDFTIKLKQAIDFGKSAGEISRDDEAKEIWRDVYPKLSGDKPGLAGYLLARAEAQVLRLSALYAAMDKSSQVRKEHLFAALALWNYAENSVYSIFGQSLGDPVADQILMALQGESEGLSRTDISKLFSRNQSSDRLQNALNILKNAGLARMKLKETPGRKVEMWFAV